MNCYSKNSLDPSEDDKLRAQIASQYLNDKFSKMLSYTVSTKISFESYLLDKDMILRGIQRMLEC